MAMSTTDELHFEEAVIPAKSMTLRWGYVWLITSLQASTEVAFVVLTGEFLRQWLDWQHACMKAGVEMLCTEHRGSAGKEAFGNSPCKPERGGVKYVSPQA